MADGDASCGYARDRHRKNFKFVTRPVIAARAGHWGRNGRAAAPPFKCVAGLAGAQSAVVRTDMPRHGADGYLAAARTPIRFINHSRHTPADIAGFRRHIHIRRRNHRQAGGYMGSFVAVVVEPVLICVNLWIELVVRLRLRLGGATNGRGFMGNDANV